MPAPQGQIIFAGTMARLPSDFQASHPPLKDFVQTLCSDIALAWTQWHAGLMGGDNNVTGLGIGGWVGSGSGGKLKETAPFNVIHTWTKTDPDGYWNTFKSATTSAFKEKFSIYANSFLFSTVPYTGTCTATPLSPGTFSANSVPGILSAYKGTATYPNGIGDLIRSKLPEKWGENKDPLDKFLKALEGSINEQFKIWETTSQFIGDTAIGIALPGAGLGRGVSLGTGKVV